MNSLNPAARIFRLLSLAVLFLARAAMAEESAGQLPFVTLTNSQLRLGFSKADGTLFQFIAKNENRLEFTTDSIGLWELDVTANGKATTLTPSLAKTFRAESAADKASLRFSWKNFQNDAAPNLEVVATVRLETNSPMSRWSFSVENLGELILRSAKFPQIGSIRKQANEMLAVPLWMGQLAKNPRAILSGADKKGRQLNWNYPGELSMQCLAFYKNNGPGIYLACDDTAAFRKTFTAWGDTHQQVNLAVIHFPERTTERAIRFAPGYDVLVGSFDGDWFTAAERYRAWATNQTWATESRKQRGLTPDWISQTALWVWNRGRSENVLSPATALQKEFGLPVSVFWHWWHGCSYDAGFPEYFPPREGTQSFTNALAAAHKKNVRALVYMNQRLWGTTTKSWEIENAAPFAVKNEDGKLRSEIYNVFTKQPCAPMCMGTTFWRNKYASLAQEAFRNLGVDGVYMDQACTSLPCFDPAHGHPLGGGRFWVDGFRSLTADIRERCNGARKIVLAGEGCGENWLPHLDLMLSLQVSRERYATPNDGWEPIPFFQSVYHPYGIFYGNYSSLTMPPYDELWPAEFAPKEPLKLLDQKFSRQFFLEQARAFVWGQQPTIANFRTNQLRERSEEIGFATRLAKVRNRATKYLRDGIFLRPPVLDAPQNQIDLSRLSIYAGRNGGLTISTGIYPTVLAGAWRASDGDVGIALANITDEPAKVSLQFDAQNFPASKGKIFRINESGRKRLGKFDSQSSLPPIELKARDACLLELTP